MCIASRRGKRVDVPLQDVHVVVGVEDGKDGTNTGDSGRGGRVTNTGDSGRGGRVTTGGDPGVVQEGNVLPDHIVVHPPCRSFIVEIMIKLWARNQNNRDYCVAQNTWEPPTSPIFGPTREHVSVPD